MNPSASLTLYTGRAAVLARLAADWLSRLAEWLAVGGPLETEGLALCRANHARCLDLARAAEGAGKSPARPESGEATQGNRTSGTPGHRTARGAGVEREEQRPCALNRRNTAQQLKPETVRNRASQTVENPLFSAHSRRDQKPGRIPKPLIQVQFLVGVPLPAQPLTDDSGNPS